jgi:hypothetical protein
MIGQSQSPIILSLIFSVSFPLSFLYLFPYLFPYLFHGKRYRKDKGKDTEIIIEKKSWCMVHH